MNECKHDWRSHGYDPDWCDKCGVDRIAYLENTLRDERQHIKEVNQINEGLSKQVSELQEELKQLKDCQNCIHNNNANDEPCDTCSFFSNWEYYN